ncbi:siderophore esteras-like protein IroE-like protein [Byssothecium circinans]|uniref:Siderophore esteras-like protein IroE-like protein n=1 Tax=Byssothecium circinans TaxID=147558 RepID=A0A6A5TT79_9PLEO|nr:siderophore esteras-like protein IroE-like protein [Byssothecium circinans]
MSAIGNWTFTSLITSFPSTIFPNLGFWNASNGTWEYQIEVAWPLNWTSRDEHGVVETLYVLDGNANGHSAIEAVRRRKPVEFNQPDTIVVSLGYPTQIPDGPYSTGRYYDYQLPVCANCTPPAEPGVPSNADNFIAFIDTELRPWIQSTLFPNTKFSRDALHGHSFGGLFVLYAMISRPDLFDTFLSASPALWWNNNYIFDHLNPLTDPSSPSSLRNSSTKPAFQLSFGHLEQYQVRRRIETDEEWEFRRSFLTFSNMSDNCKRLYGLLKNSTRLRDVELHEYPFSDHAALAAVSISDGLDYFYDWLPRIAGS